MDLENINDGTQMSYTEFLNKGNTNIERNEYSDEEYKKMAEKLNKIIKRKEILGPPSSYADELAEAAVILGAPDVVRKDREYKNMVSDFCFCEDENNKSLRDVITTAKQQDDLSDAEKYEVMLRVLNENLVIKDNYIAGISEREELIGTKGTDRKVQIMKELFVDEKGVMNYNYLTYSSRSNGEQYVKKYNSIKKKNMFGKMKTVYEKICRKENFILDKAGFEGKGDMTIDEAMQLMNIPDSEFDTLYDSKVAEEEEINYEKEIAEEKIIDMFKSPLNKKEQEKEQKAQEKRKDAKETIEDIMSIFSKEKDGKESTKSKEAVTSEDVIDRDMQNVEDTDKKNENMADFSKGKNNKESTKSKGAITSEDVINGNVQSIEYTDKEYEDMANNVEMNLGKNMNRISIIAQSLMQLGVPQELLQSSDYKPMIYSMVNQYLYEDKGKGEEPIFSQDKQGCETVLRTLNENLVIRDNYILGIREVDEKQEELTELFADENGVILESKVYCKNENNNMNIRKSFAGCNLDENGRRNVLSYKDENGYNMAYGNSSLANIGINEVREELGMNGTSSVIARNEVYQEANSKNRQLEGKNSLKEDSSRYEEKKEQERQKKSGLLAIFGKSYDSQDITGNDLNSIMGIIRESLNKNRDEKQQDNQR